MSAVLHVITALERGGAQRNTLETVARLHRTERPQLLITGGAAALDAEAEQRLGRRLARVPTLVNPVRPRDDLVTLLSLSRRIALDVRGHGAPLVVHTHSSKAGVLGRLAASAVEGTVRVHTVHGFGFEASTGRTRWALELAERAASRVTDVLVFVSEGDLALARDMGLVGHSRTEVIRSGIDPTAFAPVDDLTRATARGRIGIHDDAPVAVAVANLKPQKDPLFHVDVLAAWRRENPSARLVLVGDGPLRDAVCARASELGVDDALILPGFVDDPRPYLHAADLYLLASAWEGLPRSVLEALSSGLPAVVRDTGYAGDLAFAGDRLKALPLDAAARDFADAAEIQRARGRRVLHLPRAFTLEDMLADLDALYDDLLTR